MLTPEDLRQLSPEQRYEALLAQVCQELACQPEDLGEITEGIGIYNDDFGESWNGLLIHTVTGFTILYFPFSVEQYRPSTNVHYNAFANVLSDSIEHAKLVRRVKALEAEVRLLRAAHGLPNTIIDELQQHATD